MSRIRLNRQITTCANSLFALDDIDVVLFCRYVQTVSYIGHHETHFWRHEKIMLPISKVSVVVIKCELTLTSIDYAYEPRSA